MCVTPNPRCVLNRDADTRNGCQPYSLRPAKSILYAATQAHERQLQTIHHGTHRKVKGSVRNNGHSPGTAAHKQLQERLTEEHGNRSYSPRNHETLHEARAARDVTHAHATSTSSKTWNDERITMYGMNTGKKGADAARQGRQRAPV